MFLCFPPRGIEEEVQTGFFAYWVKTAEFPGRNKMFQTAIHYLIPRRFRGGGHVIINPVIIFKNYDPPFL